MLVGFASGPKSLSAQIHRGVTSSPGETPATLTVESQATPDGVAGAVDGKRPGGERARRDRTVVNGPRSTEPDRHLARLVNASTRSIDVEQSDGHAANPSRESPDGSANASLGATDVVGRRLDIASPNANPHRHLPQDNRSDAGFGVPRPPTSSSVRKRR